MSSTISHLQRIAEVLVGVGVEDFALPIETNGVPIVYSSNLEEEHRAAVTILRRLINRADQADKQNEITQAQAVLSLIQSNWDIEAARAFFLYHEDAEKYLHKKFDPLCTEDLTLEEQSRRLAILINITNRSDWYSLLVHLMYHEWNFVKALVDWLDDRIAPKKHPKHKSAGTGMRKDWGGKLMEMPKSSACKTSRGTTQDWPDETWFTPSTEKLAATPLTSVSTGSSQSAASQSSSPDSTQPSLSEVDNGAPVAEEPKSRHRGFLIYNDKRPTKIGCPDLTKMHLEYIRDVKYYTNSLRHKKFRWPELGEESDEDDKRSVFDWQNQKDINLLNAFRGRQLLRITGDKICPASKRMSQAERHYLYNLHQERLEHLQRQKPDTPVPLPMKTSKELWAEWTVRFNNEFEDEEDENRELRGRRSDASLRTARTRNAMLCKDFKVKPENKKLRKFPHQRPLCSLFSSPDPARDQRPAHRK